MQDFVERMRGRTWEDLPTPLRRGVSFMAVVQVVLFLFALVDLVRRPNHEVRARKFMWYPVLFVNFVGPLTYLFLGRKRGGILPGS